MSMQPGLSPFQSTGQGVFPYGGQGFGSFSTQAQFGHPLQQALQTLQFLPQQLQQLQQIQLLQHQQVQQLLQIVPAQLQQLQQTIQYIAQQIPAIAQQVPSLQGQQQFGQSPWASLQAGSTGFGIPFQTPFSQFGQPGQVM